MSKYSSAINRKNWEKHGERASMLDWGAKADGMILTDGAITAGAQVFTSASASFTAKDIGKVIWVEGAGGAGVDLLTVIEDYTSAHTVKLSLAAGATVTGALTRYGTECSAKMQAACNEALGYRGDLGFHLELTRGRYLITASIVPTHNLVIEGQGWSYHVFGTKSPSLIMCCTSVPIIDYTSTADDGWESGVIQGVSFNGTMRSGSKGIHTAKATGMLLRDCTFNWFGDQAVHCEGGVFDNHLYNLHVTGACLVRARSDYVGCIDVSQTDLMIENCIVSASCSHDGVNPVPAVDGSYGDGFIAAFAIRNANCWMSDCMAHHSQIGMYVGGAVSDTAFVNVRADDNQGHGWVIDGGSNVFDDCRAFADGQDADGTYSAFLVNGGNNDFDFPQINNFGYTGTPASPLFNRYKHAFDLHVPNTSVGCRISNPKIQPYACTDLQKKNYGTQTSHASASLTNLGDPNRADAIEGATFEVEANLSVRDHKIYIVKPDAGTGARGLADEKVWLIRPNYDLTSPGYSQLIFALGKDNYSSETPFMVFSRTSMGLDFIQLYNAVVQVLNGLDVTGKLRIANATTSFIQFLATTGIIQAGSGSPESAVTAVGGSLYLDGAGAVYAKITGTGNTGWKRLGDLPIDLATSVTGTLALALGGSGQTTAAGARTAFDVYSKGEVDTIIAGLQTQINGKAAVGVQTGSTSGHTHTQN